MYFRIVSTNIKMISHYIQNVIKKFYQEIKLAQIICWLEQTENPERSIIVF